MQKRSMKQKCLAWMLSLAIALTFIPLTAGVAFADPTDPIEITADDVVIPPGDNADESYSWTGLPIYPMPTVTVDGTELSCKSIQKQAEDPEVIDENGQFIVKYPDTVNNQYTKNGEWTIVVEGVEPEYTGTVTKKFTISWGTIQEFTVKETNGKYEDAGSFETIKSSAWPIEEWDAYVQHNKITAAWIGKNNQLKTASTSSFIPLNSILSKENINFGEGDLFEYASNDSTATLSYDHLTKNVYGKNDSGEIVDITNSIIADDPVKYAFVLALDDRPGNNPRSIVGNNQDLNALNGMQAALSGILSMQVIHPVDISVAEVSGLKAIYALGESTEVTPEFTLKDGEVTLVKDTDYTVAYEGNDAVGDAKVTITGKGYYKGTVEKVFKIVADADAIVDEYGTLNEQYAAAQDTIAQNNALINLLENPVSAKVSGVTTSAGTISLTTKADKDGFAVNGKKQTAATYAAKGLAAGSSNSFKINAYKMVGDTEVQGQPVTVKVNTKPATVAKAPSVAAAKKALTVKSWKTAKGAAKYQISVSTSKTGTSVKATKTKAAKTNIKKLKSKKTYYVKVRAVSKAGVAGAWSPVKKIKTK